MTTLLITVGVLLLGGALGVWLLCRGARAYLEAEERSSFPQPPVVPDARPLLDAGARLGGPAAPVPGVWEKIHGLEVKPVAPAKGRKGIGR